MAPSKRRHSRKGYLVVAKHSVAAENEQTETPENENVKRSQERSDYSKDSTQKTAFIRQCSFRSGSRQA